jgi:hypothetical protein
VPVTGRAVANLRIKGVLTELPRLAVTGTASASRVTMGPGERPPVAVERLEVAGLDANWPDRCHPRNRLRGQSPRSNAATLPVEM